MDSELIDTIITSSIGSGKVHWTAGTVINGRAITQDVYVVNTIAFVAEKLLGKGASGAVHLVRNAKTKKKQAIKVQRTTRYASAQMKISHLFAETLIAHDSENTYIVLPYYEMSLASWFERHQRHGTDSSAVVRILRKASESLQIIQDKGYVHLDIKNNNIMVSEDGVVTVIDFGRTKKIGSTDVGFGLPFDPSHYLAPEILTSDRYTVDPSNDIWSLGQMFSNMSHAVSSNDFQRLVTSMLNVNQSKRPTLAEVILSLRRIESSFRKAAHGRVAFAPAPVPPAPAIYVPALNAFCPPCDPPVTRKWRFW